MSAAGSYVTPGETYAGSLAAYVGQPILDRWLCCEVCNRQPLPGEVDQLWTGWAVLLPGDVLLLHVQPEHISGGPRDRTPGGVS